MLAHGCGPNVCCHAMRVFSHTSTQLVVAAFRGIEVSDDDVDVAIVVEIADVKRGMARSASLERVPLEVRQASSARARPAPAAHLVAV